MLKIYSDRTKRFNKEYLFYKARHRTLASVRIVSFLLWLATIIYLFNEREAALVFLFSLIYFVFFALLIKKHNKIRFQYALHKGLVDINNTEINKLKNDFSNLDTGKRYIDKDHPYHIDLDVFGVHSIFQLINHTTSDFGRVQLSKWLSFPSSKMVITERQKAVKELGKNIDFLQYYEATGKIQNDNFNIEDFKDWINSDAEHSYKNYIHLRWPLFAFNALVLGLLYYFDLSFGIFIPFLVLNGLVLRKVFASLKTSTEQSEDGDKQFKSLYEQILLVEQNNFESAKLQEITKVFHQSPKPSLALKKLTKLLSFLESRGNFFYVSLNVVFLLDLHLMAAIRSWKSKYRQDIDLWIDGLARLEAVISLASFHHTFPEYCFPTITDNSYNIEGKNIGHPLIHKEERVSNDVSFGKKGEVGLITGSNMSGKSTFLRTLGINMVLAFSGGPVCAETFQLGRFNIFTSMRTQDNLSESVSSFYAELKRIKQLLDQLSREKEPVFYVLDEILKGTNSHDRHNGALALMRQLQEEHCFGFISTHDLELSHETSNDPKVDNFSFNSEIVDGALKFDYTLTSGSCKSFNASHLMQMMGIKIKENEK